jgi:hypothetical protein
VEADNERLSIRQQCELLGLNRTSYYYEPVDEERGEIFAIQRLFKHQARRFLGKKRLEMTYLSSYLSFGQNNDNLPGLEEVT